LLFFAPRSLWFQTVGWPAFDDGKQLGGAEQELAEVIKAEMGLRREAWNQTATAPSPARWG